MVTPSNDANASKPLMIRISEIFLAVSDIGPFYANVSMIANGALALFSLYGLNAFTWSHAASANPDWDVMQYQGYAWRDPKPDILAAYHEIMFRLGLSAARNASLVDPITLGGQTFTSRRSMDAEYVFDENYFVSDFYYLAGAMTVILLAILSLIPTFRGWWNIGRRTTLSPLETAKAFGAPLLVDCHSNAQVRDLVDQVQDQIVRYGVTKEVGESEGRLLIGKFDEVHPPSSGTMFRM